jgi:hypothetical protein
VHHRDGRVVGLAPGIRITAGALVDVDAREYPVDGLGEAVCSVLSEPVDLDTVIEGFAVMRDAARDDVEAGLDAFLDDLERRELLSSNSSFLREALDRLAAVPARLATMLVTRHPLPPVRRATRRYAGDAWGLLRAVVEAHQGLSWLGVVLVLGGVAIALALAPTAQIAWLGVRTALLFGAGYALLVLLMVVVHEAGHLVAAHLSGATVFGSYARLGAAGVSSSTPSPTRRMLVAAAGPFAAFLVAVAAAALIRFGSDDFWVHAAVDQLRLSAFVASVALALAQVFCVTPLTVDGRALWSGWRELRDA